MRWPSGAVCFVRVKEQYEKTIDSFCRMAKDGMEATDRKILEIMIEGC